MLSEKEQSEILQIAGHYEHKRAASIEALRLVQQGHGWISDEDLKAVASLLHMTPDELDSVATFYSLIHRRKVGRHVLYLCDSVSCWMMGCTGLSTLLKARLDISFGETTSDGRFTLIPVCCLGACDQAPVLMINSDTYTQVNADNLDGILEKYP